VDATNRITGTHELFRLAEPDIVILMDFIDLKTQYKRIEQSLDRRIKTVFEHGQYILGPEVAELEETLAEYVGTDYCIAVSSGTDALLIAMMALGIGRDDEVITTPFSFIATAETISLLGARPVFVDIDPRSFNIDASKIEDAISNRTRAILPVSIFGQCPDIDTINSIAEKYSLPVIEDGAQSFGATYKDRRSCGLTTIGCTSFFPSKPLGCYGDAGACFTNDKELAKKIREIRVHGQSERYRHARIGVNGRIDTMQAAILLEKFSLFPDEVDRRQKIAGQYSEMLTSSQYVTPHIEPYNTSVYAQYTLLVDNRDAVQVHLKEKGIPTAIHYPTPLHQQPVYADAGYDRNALLNSESVAARVLSMPMHPYLDAGQQEHIVTSLMCAPS
jgi:UDP-2-acetamido-2-deoxy-ribo-hexuluronate aminotransferase